MAKKYEVVPSVGIGPLQLGMSRKDVIAALGERGVTGEPPDEFFENCLQVEYKTGGVVFIQVSRDSPFETLYKDCRRLLRLTTQQQIVATSASMPIRLADTAWDDDTDADSDGTLDSGPVALAVSSEIGRRRPLCN